MRLLDHIIFHKGRINLHPHQQCRRVPISLQPIQNLLFENLGLLLLTAFFFFHLGKTLSSITAILTLISPFFPAGLHGIYLFICLANLYI